VNTNKREEGSPSPDTMEYMGLVEKLGGGRE